MKPAPTPVAGTVQKRLKMAKKNQISTRLKKTFLNRLTVSLATLGAFFVGGYIALRNYFRQQKSARHTGYVLAEAPNPATAEFLRAGEAVTGSAYTDGNRVEFLINGDQIFPAMLDAIKSARISVNLVTFVYWKGPIAPLVADAICDRAKAGVCCNVLLDAFGAAKIDRELIDNMRDSGAKVVWFRPPRITSLHKLDNRTHRKLLIVDGKIGFTGGVGIAEEWMGNAEDPLHWRDTHVRVEGPVVRELQGAFCENWLEATGELLVGEKYLPPLPPIEGGIKAQVTRSSAGIGNTNSETLFFLAIASAKTRIWLTVAYFVPTFAFRKALAEAARRGVDVRIIVPGPYIDKSLVKLAGRATYSQLLQAGVKIYEYQTTMLHAKTLVVDSIWSTIGSTNFDNRSFSLNDEANISFYATDVAALMEAQFEADMASSKEFRYEKWHRRDFVQRLWNKIGFAVRREL
jgi:cardiolipin synthase A/B